MQEKTARLTIAGPVLHVIVSHAIREDRQLLVDNG